MLCCYEHRIFLKTLQGILTIDGLIKPVVNIQTDMLKPLIGSIFNHQIEPVAPDVMLSKQDQTVPKESSRLL